MVDMRVISSPHYFLMTMLTFIISFVSAYLSYLSGSFHPSFIEEYAGGLLMALQKQDGGIRPILCGEIWRRCFASLVGGPMDRSPTLVVDWSRGCRCGPCKFGVRRTLRMLGVSAESESDDSSGDSQPVHSLCRQSGHLFHDSVWLA